MKLPSTARFASYSTLAVIVSMLIAPNAWAQSESDEDSDNVFFEEIIVEAERRERSIQDTAMTITGFTSDMIESLRIQDRDKLQALVPGLQFGETVDQVGNGTSLRGIGTRNAGIDHGDRSVATYVDGAYTIGVYGVAPGGGFDLERVEVARGPQGTLNGRNSIAGSINFIYKKPTPEWDVDVMAQVTDVSQQRLNMAVGGPIAGGLSFRATGGIYTGDGFQENVGSGEDMGAPDHQFLAGQLRFQTDKFDTNIRVSRVTDEGVPQAQVNLANLNTTDPMIQLVGAYSVGNPPPFPLDPVVNTNYLNETAVPSGPADCPVGVPFQRCGDIENRVAQNRPGYEDSQADMINFYAQYDFTDRVSLRYIYSNNDVSQNVFRDGDYTTRVGSAADHSLASDGNVEFLDRTYNTSYDYEEESHELLLTWNVNDKLDLIAGLFTYESEVQFFLQRNEYSHTWRFDDPDVNASFLDGVFGVPVANCQEFIDNVVVGLFGLSSNPADPEFWYCPGTFGDPGRMPGDLTALVPFGTGSLNETEAIFANVDYRFNDKWSMSAGLRYLEDTKEQPPETFAGTFMFSFIGVPVVVGFLDGGFDEPESWDNVVGQFTLEYRTDAGNMIYGRYSTGHKPGVFNFASPPVPGVPTVVEESTLDNYEIGLKGTYLDGRAQIAVGGFWMVYDRMHLAATQDLTGGFIPPATAETPLAEYIAAIPDTDVWGLEFEYSYAFSDRTSVVGFYAFTDSEVGEHSSVVLGDPDAEYGLWDHIDFETGLPTQSWYELPQDQTGNQLPNQPNHKFAATLIHDIDLSGGSIVTLSGTYSWTDEMYPTIANVELYKIPSLTRIDLGATWTSPTGAWSTELWVNNVTDEIGVNDFVASGGFGGQVFLGHVTRPREVGLTVALEPELLVSKLNRTSLRGGPLIPPQRSGEEVNVRT